MPSRLIAAATLEATCSKANSGLCTPMIWKPYLWYVAYHASRCGRVRRQLMHEYVQKSTRTTWPRSPAIESGGELNHCPPAMIGGAFAITGSPLAPGPAEATAGVVVVVGSS